MIFSVDQEKHFVQIFNTLNEFVCHQNHIAKEDVQAKLRWYKKQEEITDISPKNHRLLASFVKSSHEYFNNAFQCNIVNVNPTNIRSEVGRSIHTWLSYFYQPALLDNVSFDLLFSNTLNTSSSTNNQTQTQRILINNGQIYSAGPTATTKVTSAMPTQVQQQQQDVQATGSVSESSGTGATTIQQHNGNDVYSLESVCDPLQIGKDLLLLILLIVYLFRKFSHLFGEVIANIEESWKYFTDFEREVESRVTQDNVFSFLLNELLQQQDENRRLTQEFNDLDSRIRLEDVTFQQTKNPQQPITQHSISQQQPQLVFTTNVPSNIVGVNGNSTKQQQQQPQQSLKETHIKIPKLTAATTPINSGKFIQILPISASTPVLSADQSTPPPPLLSDIETTKDSSSMIMECTINSGSSSSTTNNSTTNDTNNQSSNNSSLSESAKKRGRAKTKSHYYCPYCNKCFQNKYKMSRHTFVHKDPSEKPFKCSWPDCGYRSISKNDLSRHGLTHSGEKPCVCNIDGCEKRYSRPDKLRNHQQAVHAIVHTKKDAEAKAKPLKNISNSKGGKKKTNESLHKDVDLKNTLSTLDLSMNSQQHIHGEHVMIIGQNGQDLTGRITIQQAPLPGSLDVSQQQQQQQPHMQMALMNNQTIPLHSLVTSSSATSATISNGSIVQHPTIQVHQQTPQQQSQPPGTVQAPVANLVNLNVLNSQSHDPHSIVNVATQPQQQSTTHTLSQAELQNLGHVTQIVIVTNSGQGAANSTPVSALGLQNSGHRILQTVPVTAATTQITVLPNNGTF